MICMNRAWILALSAILACPGPAQTSSAGPLGVLVSPPKRLQPPPDIRSAIPSKSIVRLIQPTQLKSDGEIVVIYDLAEQYEPNAHIAVFKDHIQVADFSLVKLFGKDIGGTYALFQSAQLSLSPSRNGFIAAFRNIGDGAGTLFVLITENGGKYVVAWQKGATQAQFQVHPGGTFQFWDSHGDGDCVWCPSHYEVTNFAWKNDALAKVSSFATKHALSPYQFSERPILLKP
jgi:hypothetical protein